MAGNMRVVRCTRVEPANNMSRPILLCNAFIDLNCAAEKSLPRQLKLSFISLEQCDKTCFYQEVWSG